MESYSLVLSLSIVETKEDASGRDENTYLYEVVCILQEHEAEEEGHGGAQELGAAPAPSLSSVGLTPIAKSKHIIPEYNEFSKVAQLLSQGVFSNTKSPINARIWVSALRTSVQLDKGFEQ